MCKMRRMCADFHKQQNRRQIRLKSQNVDSIDPLLHR